MGSPDAYQMAVEKYFNKAPKLSAWMEANVPEGLTSCPGSAGFPRKSWVMESAKRLERTGAE